MPSTFPVIKSAVVHKADTSHLPGTFYTSGYRDDKHRLGRKFQAVKCANMKIKISDVSWEGGASMSGCSWEVLQQVTFKQRLEGKGTLWQREELFLKDKNRPAWLECGGQGGCVRWGENWAGLDRVPEWHRTHLGDQGMEREGVWKPHALFQALPLKDSCDFLLKKDHRERRVLSCQSLKNCELWIHINPPSIFSYLYKAVWD